MSRATIILFASLLAPGLLFAADCRMRLEVSNVEWRGGATAGYDVFAEDEFLHTVYFKVRNLGGGCSYFVTFTTGGSGNYQRKMSGGDQALEYLVFENQARRNILKDLPDASGAEVLTGQFSEGEESQQLSYTILIPPRQVRKAGRYQDHFQIRLYSGTLADYKMEDVQNVTLSCQVPELAEVSLGPPGHAFRRNQARSEARFGTLRRGQSMEFDLRLRGNAGYEIALESENGGFLKHNDGSEKVPYELKLAGAPLGLSSGRQAPLTQKNRLTSVEGDTYNLSIVIGDLASAAAGDYRDTIVITVTVP